jgi:hypothetical protein
MKASSGRLKKTMIALVLAFLAAQFVRMDKSNPPVRSDLTAPPAVKAALRGACYNCHSNETVWPWYSNIAPASWLIAADVKEGRGHMNFSEWGTYDSETQSHQMRSVTEEVGNHDMPPWYYRIAHSEAQLSQSDRDLILAWASGVKTRAEP